MAKWKPVGKCKRALREVGEFETPSGRVIVSDPTMAAPKQGQMLSFNAEIKVPRTKWRASVLTYTQVYERDGKRNTDTRVAQLIAVTEDNACKKDTQLDVGLGVDTGQAGIFDAAHYAADQDVDLDRLKKDMKTWSEKMSDADIEESPWYWMVTLLNQKTGVASLVPDIKGKMVGVSSSSGYGDGIYEVRVGKTKGQVTQIRLLFIEPTNCP